MATRSIQYLLSLPPAMACEFPATEHCFPASDPAGSKLGSGGGFAHLLIQAWRCTGEGKPLGEWLRDSLKLAVLAGGQSRRLPAYAAVSQILLPFKVLRGSVGQRLDQTLLEMQTPDYERVVAHAPASYVAMAASGGVFLRFADHLPPFPEVDILTLGMWVKPEIAKDFGVFFTRRDRPDELSFVLQKPTVAEIQRLSATHNYAVDTGLWLLSERAILFLLRRCGWNGETFANGLPNPCDLYSQLGQGLGAEPRRNDPELRELSCAVLPLPEAEFYHLATNRHLIQSISALENRLHEALPNATGPMPHPDQHVQSSLIDLPLRRQENHTLWVENSTIPKTWTLEHEHVLTGIPSNQWSLRLSAGTCLDFVPIGETDYCIRAYGIDDEFKGQMGSEGTLWFGRPVVDWFSTRGMSSALKEIDPRQDIQECPLFPCLPGAAIDGEFVQWLCEAKPEISPFAPGGRREFIQWLAAKPEPTSRWRELWLNAPRLSAQQLSERINLRRLYRQRHKNLGRSLRRMFVNQRWDFVFNLDLQATAEIFAKTSIELPPLPETADNITPMQRIHDRMFRASIARLRKREDWEGREAEAFRQLQDLILDETRFAPPYPRCDLFEDQIIWGRSPVRLDLAGGWSDTPPYCLERGGKVLNLAVNLNGQPPVQVFAKRCERPEIVLRSTDLGIQQQIETFEELGGYQEPGAAFSLAKAALALVGFLPRFHATGEFSTLRSQLEAFGGGIEITLLAAAPKGSGLGTSSILSATLLGVLSELCSLGWNRETLFSRTLMLEQMLTTGGGWQDQAGALYRGIKLIETAPGLHQKPVLRWLPEHFLAGEESRSRLLLYYTGITRLAKNILKEIVAGMLLNSRKHLDIIDEIRANADTTFNAIQTSDWEGLCGCIRNSWELNQRLDAGTAPPSVLAILAAVEPYLDAAKLLGAGGGGYLMMFAKNAEAARKIRATLTTTPPNAMARFVEFSISETGLQITRS